MRENAPRLRNELTSKQIKHKNNVEEAIVTHDEWKSKRESREEGRGHPRNGYADCVMTETETAATDDQSTTTSHQHK